MPVSQHRVRYSAGQRRVPQRIELDGLAYRIACRYSAATARWSIDIANDAGVLLVAGLRLVLGVDLLAPYRSRGVPPGQLWCYDTARHTSPNEATHLEPDLEAFDGRVLLLYRPAAEVVEP